MWLIQNADTDDERFTFRMTPGAIKTIGRVTGVDFIVDAALVSRVHCRLEAREEAVDVVDLKSTNGTFINDTRVERGQARQGDRLRVGRVEFQISRAV
jgi:adenylate cyclase